MATSSWKPSFHSTPHALDAPSSLLRIPNTSPEELFDISARVADRDTTLQVRDPETSWLVSPSPSPKSSRSQPTLLGKTDPEMEMSAPKTMQNQRPLLLASTRTSPRVVDSKTSKVTTDMGLDTQHASSPLNSRQLKPNPRPFVGYGDLKSTSLKEDSGQSQDENQRYRRATCALTGKVARSTGISEASTLESQSLGSGQEDASGTAPQPSLRAAIPANPEYRPVFPLSNSWRGAHSHHTRSVQQAQDGQEGGKNKGAEEKRAIGIPPEGKGRLSSVPYPQFAERIASRIPRSNTFEGTASHIAAKPRIPTPFWPKSRRQDDSEGNDSISDGESYREPAGSQAKNTRLVQRGLKLDKLNGEHASTEIKASDPSTVKCLIPFPVLGPCCFERY